MEGSLETNGGSIFYKVIGRGYPLVLMHGGPGSDHTYLLSLKNLADSFTLVFYDHRCNGRSSGPSLQSMNWENLTADAENLRKHLGHERWAVLGHSFGGMVALEYSLRHPESLSHLILLDSGVSSYWFRENAPLLLKERGFNAKTIDGAKRLFSGEIRTNEAFWIKLRLLPAYYYGFNWMKKPFTKRPKSNIEALIYGFNVLLANWDFISRLGNIKTPTLVAAGRDDFIFPPEHQAIIADKIPNSRLEIIEKAGHNTANERPIEVMRLVKNFILFPPEHQTLIADRLPNARLKIIEKTGYSARE
jgi:proline iminopeptidase